MTARSLLQSIGAYRSIAALIDRVQTFTSPQKVQGRANLGAAASGANSDITSLTGLTTPLSVAQGGTAGTTDTAARAALSAAKSGANTDITSLTNIILRDLVTILSTTTNPSLEIGRVDGNASTPYFDFHSSATLADYNARIIASGGSGTAGSGDLTLISTNCAVGGNIILNPKVSSTPSNNGEMVFQLTSNTQLTIKVKGSDGVVRSANITLA